MSSTRWVVVTPPQAKASQAAKNTEKPAHPMSTIKRRRLLAMGWFSRLPESTHIPSPACANSLPRLRGRVGWGLRVGAYRPASPTVTAISFTSPARTTLTVWVAPTLILRSPAYRSSRLLVTVPFRATIVSPCIRPALSAGL